MVYLNYQRTRWQEQDYVLFAFSSSPNYHDIHNYPGYTFEAVKTFTAATKQMIPANKRNYDNSTKIWMIPESNFRTLITIFGTVHYKYTEVKDIATYIARSKHDWQAWLDANTVKFSGNSTERKLDINPEKPEDFFYSFKEQVSPSSSSNMTQAQLEAKLSSIIGGEVNKKSYLKAVMRLHPDRNNGDGSKMSELNMYWQEYQKICPTLVTK